MPGPDRPRAGFEPDAAKCRFFARGARPAFSFGASASPRLTDSGMGDDLLAQATTGAAGQGQGYRECMAALGWGAPATLPAPPSRPEDRPEPIPVSHQAASALPPITGPARPSAERRRLRLRVDAVSPDDVASLRLPHGGGMIVLEALPGGVGSTAGLRPGDVILALDEAPIMGAIDLDRKLGTVTANSVVVATVWRDGRNVPAALHF